MGVGNSLVSKTARKKANKMLCIIEKTVLGLYVFLVLKCSSDMSDRVSFGWKMFLKINHFVSLRMAPLRIPPSKASVLKNV